MADSWPEIGGLPYAPSKAWANAALIHIGEIMGGQRRVLKASREGAELGAEMLSPRPFQGIVEALQNADDVRASNVHLAVRVNGRREFLIAHDGEPVQLSDVWAMLLPYVTPKRHDSDASGRFGIGQMTLRSLGHPIEVHCPPFHFSMTTDGPKLLESPASILGLYDPEARDTLIVVPLHEGVDVKALAQAVEDLGPAGLIFLRTVRRLTYSDAIDSVSRDFQLIETAAATVSLEIGDQTTRATRATLQPQVDGVQRETEFVRFLWDKPLSSGERRAHKATGGTTPVGVCLLPEGADAALYNRVPLPIVLGFPFSLNAQFDPDSARSALQPNNWNRRRLTDLASLTAAVSRHEFASSAETAWRAIPLVREVPIDGEWLSRLLRDDFVPMVHDDLRSRNAAVYFRRSQTPLSPDVRGHGA